MALAPLQPADPGSGGPPTDGRSTTRSGTSYAQVIRLAGIGYVGWTFLARLATAMLYLGTLLYAGERTGSFAAAGAMVSLLGVGGVVGAPLVGRLADRFGHRGPGIVLALAQAVTVLALVITVETGARSTPVLLVLAALVGLVNPQIGSLSRSRWSTMIRRRPNGAADRGRVITTAMALEAVLDETSFVLGPVVAGLLGGIIHPAAALITAAALGLVAQLAFAVHPSAARHSDGPHSDALHSDALHSDVGAADSGSPDTTTTRPALALRRLAPLALGCLSVGLVFGTTQTGIAAHYDRIGLAELTGLVYAGVGVGSALAGAATPRLPARFRIPVRPLIAALGLVPAACLLAISPTPLLTALACLAVGVCVAPILITGYALAEREAHPSVLATTMTVLAMATTLGVSGGAAVTGWAVERTASTTGLWLPAAAGLVAVIAGAWILAVHRARPRKGLIR